MLLLRVMAKVAGLLALAFCLGGCVPAESHVDEKADPDFQKGRSLVNNLDFKGAAAEFEKALETNPRSAAAHFELAWLDDTKLNDSAAAIYHYQRHLQLQPDSDRAQLVKDRIRGCKLELAGAEFPPPDTQNLQRQVDRLTAENFALKQQLTALQRGAATVNLAPAPLSQPPPQTMQAPARPAAVALPVAVAAASPIPAHPRVHFVKQRETMASIAARYGLKAAAVLAANPRVDPRRLRIGQSLNLP